MYKKKKMISRPGNLVGSVKGRVSGPNTFSTSFIELTERMRYESQRFFQKGSPSEIRFALSGTMCIEAGEPIK